MVYKLEDLKHLEVVASLEDKQPIDQDFKLFSENNDISFAGAILKLCSNLRAEGFAKYADNLEEKFINLKAAQTTKAAGKLHLYNTHNETGEDLLNEAHPEGDVKMGDATDNNGVVETLVSKHKKIVDLISKEPTGKVLASYVEQCKIVLADFLNDSKETEPLKKKFSEFVKNLLPDLNRVIVQPLADEKYQEITLPNGKQVKDYNTNTLPELFSSLTTNADWASEGGAKRIIGAADTLIKSIYDLTDQIDKAIDKGSSQFDNQHFPDIVYAALNTHREEFLSLYAMMNKDQGAAQWHGQFIAPDALLTKVEELITKLLSISTRIDRHILQEPAFKPLTKFVAWFAGTKNYVDGIIRNLSELISASKRYIDSMSQLHKGNQALIDANKLKELLNQINPDILTMEGINNTTNDANELVSSFNAIYTDVLNICKNSLQNVKIDENTKQEIIKHFQD
jgi:hypothetical protein